MSYETLIQKLSFQNLNFLGKILEYLTDDEEGKVAATLLRSVDSREAENE